MTPTPSPLSSVFHCQPSLDQSGQLYTPSIPDFYFNPENAAELVRGREGNLTRSVDGLSYIYTVPPLSSERDCTGTVVGIEYCYRKRRGGDFSGRIFYLLSLTRSESQNGFIITRAMAVQANTNMSECIEPNNGSATYTVCCESVDFDTANQFQLPTTEYTLGVTISAERKNVRPLIFDRTTLEFSVEMLLFPPDGQGGVGNNVGQFIPEADRQLNPLLVLRLKVGMYNYSPWFIDASIPML